MEPTKKSIAKGGNPRRTRNGHTFRLEYFPHQGGSFLDNPRPASLKNWNRVFEVSDKTTLEQFATIIIDLLGWEDCHLYEFHVGGAVYAYMGDPEYSDYFIDAVNPCVSCAIRLHYLKLTPGTTLDFIFDFGDLHLFRLTLLSTSPHQERRPLPVLLSHRGKNLLQYSGAGPISPQDRMIRDKTPNIKPPQLSGDISTVIRFVRAEDRATLLKWRASNDKTLWSKAVAVLENRSLSLQKISEKIDRPVKIVRRWIVAFNHRGILGLRPPRKSRRLGEHEAAAEKKKRLLDIIHDRPRSFGINRASWNLASLAKAYIDKYGKPISRSTVGRLIQQAGYSLRKARRVLTSPDPEYREKVEQVLNTLQNLKPDELFFFVDELGPLRVKKYGGRTLARKGDVPTFPQLQLRKGAITMAGALSATANQVTWLFSPTKDTQSMIDLIEILYNQHPTVARIFLTWDAASWHRSIALIEWLDGFNAQTAESGVGPIIQLVPLPTSAQFLDVLEAVFSGMKRAVVHHSDYQSVTELKAAVSSHFVERNTYFKENPKRAGKKIWEVDFFQDTGNLRSGDYREW